MGVPQIGTDFLPPKSQQLKRNCLSACVIELNKYHLDKVNCTPFIFEEKVINS